MTASNKQPKVRREVQLDPDLDRKARHLAADLDLSGVPELLRVALEQMLRRQRR